MRELDASGSQWVAPDARSATVNQTVRCIRTRRTAKRNRVSTILPAGNAAPRIPPSSLVGVSGFDDQRADPSLIVPQGPQGPEVHCLLNIMKHDRSRQHAQVSRSRSQSCMVMLKAIGSSSNPSPHFLSRSSAALLYNSTSAPFNVIRFNILDTERDYLARLISMPADS